MTETEPTDRYDPTAVETKWQRLWRERGTNSFDLRDAEKPFYNLMMFPYPSAEGLHIGNVFAFVGADIQGRYRRLQGMNVFEPLGFDAFGIHSENFALKVNTHPADLIPRNIANFRTTLERTGLMIDWSHVLSTTDPEYYRWTQWIFLQLYRAGLAVKKKAPVNWCPECKTVLANEQVIDGFCERHPETRVSQRYLEQWFFKITEYADRLLDNLSEIDWSDSTRAMQANWIGKSNGAELVFPTPVGKAIRVFTTRPDTVFGATYMVLAPEHPLVAELTADEQRNEVTKYLRQVAQQDIVSRKVGTKQKSGVFTGSYARNPATGASIPIWIADYVLLEYGTGAIMAVPAHDDRDFEFATQYGLPITKVVEPADSSDPDLPFATRDGRLVNSGKFDGMPCEEAIVAVTEWLAEQGVGELQTQYRLHDWCISRQRYWGPPIPIVYCDRCGIKPVPESDLPVLLPYLEDFKPDESGLSPLARATEWNQVKCPECGSRATRETDVSDTFLDSAWYFLRYPSTDVSDRAFESGLTEKWLPVSSYIGGNEHAVLHLLYSRFITMVLKDLGLVAFEEPFTKFRAHGTIIKDGAKMSKSRGNVVIPDAYMDQWGADTIRMYLMFLGPYQEGGDFRDDGISGIRRFLDKVWALVAAAGGAPASGDRERERKLHQTIEKVADDVEALRYNTAIAALMEYVNVLRDGDGAPDAGLVSPLVVMLAPLAPHFAEECWEILGNSESVFDTRWPQFDAELARIDEVEFVVQVNGKVRSRMLVAAGSTETAVLELVRADETARKFIGGGEIRKVVFVPDRLINLVV